MKKIKIIHHREEGYVAGSIQRFLDLYPNCDVIHFNFTVMENLTGFTYAASIIINVHEDTNAGQTEKIS